MIDIEKLDQQLELALTHELRAQLKRPGDLRRREPAVDEPAVHRPPTPPPAVAPSTRAGRAPAITPPVRTDGGLDGHLGLEGHARRIVELVERGRLGEADHHIAAHRALAEGEGTVEDRRDGAAWATMRALLDGRQADARAGTARVLALGQQAADPAAMERYWEQRFWLVVEWGDEEERADALDQCRQRAYWHDDMGWRSALALLLARMGRPEEARREFDATAERTLDARPRHDRWLDVTTNLADAVARLGDARRATLLNRAVAWPNSGMVVTGRAWVCKGSIARFRALVAATTGRWSEADDAFRMAAELHRRTGAEILLARTLREWGGSLTGRDDSRARDCLQESAELARRLQLVEAALDLGDPGGVGWTDGGETRRRR